MRLITDSTAWRARPAHGLTIILSMVDIGIGKQQGPRLSDKLIENWECLEVNFTPEKQ